jgi:hypothetical protein
MDKDLVFIDESGDHNLKVETFDNQYNVFVLSVVLIKDQDYQEFDKRLKKLKNDFFGSENFVLHTAELTRPGSKKSDPRNVILRNKETRTSFYTSLNALIEKTTFKSIFAIINKKNHCNQYHEPLDPYVLCFENVLNRIMHFSKSEHIEIYPEKRNSNLDKLIESDFNKYKEIGIRFHKSENIKRRIKEFTLKSKKENISGLQLADLIALPVGRQVIGKEAKRDGNEVPYSLVLKKLAGKLAITRIV